MFAIPIAIAAPVIYGLAWGGGTSMLVPTLGLIGMTVVLGALTVWLARRVLEPAQRLEEARRIVEDAYERARSESLRDPLTGLGNHRAFQEEMERQWAHSTRHGLPLALALLDIDDFKQINDTRGHAAGDRLLRHAATLAATYLRRSDRAFRVGGDEFAIILPGTGVEGAHVVIRRLLAACLEGEGEGSERMEVSFSAGIGAIPGLARDRDSLYGQAEAAILWGKRHGRTCVTIYDQERHDLPISERPQAELSALVARVAATGAVRAVFQPIYDLATGAPRGYEGLVRPLPDSGFTDAGSMFAAAEVTGRTGELDLACLNTVMETAAGLRLPGNLSVNLSPRTMEMDDFSVHALVRLIVRHGLDPRRVVLELTEREAVEDLGPAAAHGRGVPRRRHPDRRRRRGRRERRAAAAQPAPVRHRQDRPVAGPGRRPPGRLARGRPDPARPGRPLGRARRRRRHRDAGPARRRPLARDRGGPGLPAGPAERPPADRAARPRGTRPERGMARRAAPGDAGMTVGRRPRTIG